LKKADPGVRESGQEDIGEILTIDRHILDLIYKKLLGLSSTKTPPPVKKNLYGFAESYIWGQLIDNLITLAPIFDYNNQIADLLQTG
jgi:hypothetical protein